MRSTEQLDGATWYMLYNFISSEASRNNLRCSICVPCFTATVYDRQGFKQTIVGNVYLTREKITASIEQWAGIKPI
jgi:hypothetical protein